MFFMLGGFVGAFLFGETEQFFTEWYNFSGYFGRVTLMDVVALFEPTPGRRAKEAGEDTAIGGALLRVLIEIEEIAEAYRSQALVEATLTKGGGTGKGLREVGKVGGGRRGRTSANWRVKSASVMWRKYCRAALCARPSD